MTGLRTRTWLTGLIVVVGLATVGLLVSAYGEQAAPAEGRVRPAPIDPEKAEEIWRVQARVAARAAEIKGEDAGKVVKAYIAAQQAYAEKVRELARTREAFEQRQEIARKANADLKEALTKAVGEGKAEKVIGLVGPFGMMGSRLDRMVGDLIAFKLPREKLGQAAMAVMEHSREQAKLFAEARESGSFEGAREKMQQLTEALNKKLAEILTEEQMTQWNERYARPFGGPGGAPAGRQPGAEGGRRAPGGRRPAAE